MKTKIKQIIFILLMLAVTFIYSCGCFAGTNSFKRGLQRENGNLYYYVNGQKVKNSWRNVRLPSGKVRKFYFSGSGIACTGVLHYQGSTYVFNKYGRMQAYTGNKLFEVNGFFYSPGRDGKCVTNKWIQSGGKLYYATSTGRIARNAVIEGVTFKNSKPVMNAAYRYKELCFRIFHSITNDHMSMDEKLRACWNYMVSSRFSYVLRQNPDRTDPMWMRKKAYEMLITNGGDCVSFACAFAGLAIEAGYKPVVVYGRVPGSRDHAPDGFTTHCWVKIEGRYYDPEAHFAGWRTNVYGLNYYPIAYQVHNAYSYRTGKVL